MRQLLPAVFCAIALHFNGFLHKLLDACNGTLQQVAANSNNAVIKDSASTKEEGNIGDFRQVGIYPKTLA